MAGWVVPQGGPYLAPHPWDSFGKAPRPGTVYDAPTDVDTALLMAEKLRRADADYEEAESLEDEARDLKRNADEATEEARALAEKVNHPALVKAIESKPNDFRHEEDITAWLDR